MKPLTGKSHGLLDYLVGILLLASPWLFGFNMVSSVATITMVVVGVVVLSLSLITDYPWGIIKAVPFKVHGVIETIGALGLLVAPWVLGFAELDVARNLAVIVAIAWLGVVALTNYNVLETHRGTHYR